MAKDFIYLRPCVLGSTREHQISIDQWNGKISITANNKVDGRVQFRDPVIRIDLDRITRMFVRTEMEKCMVSAPGTKHPLSKTTRDRETKQFNPEWNITFYRDEKLVFHVTLIDAKKRATVDVPFSCGFGMQYGSDQIPDADKSLNAFKVTLEFLKNLEVLTPFADEKWDPNAKKGGNGGGNYGGGQKANPPASAMDPDDDMPF